MAYANKTIANHVTGQTIRFLKTGKDTNGERLEMESTWKAHTHEPAEHYHPHQAEAFTVLSGELTVRMDGRVQTLRPGDTLHIPANKPHSMWNPSDQPVMANWQVTPALDTEQFFETIFGLANEGKVNAKGMPPFLQLVLLANRYLHVIRLTKPGFAVQKVLFTFLTPVAYLVGYRPTYRRYID